MKKETKTTKKVTKKTSEKPEIVVDVTTANTCMDIAYEHVQAKIRAGLPITQCEANTIEKYGFYTAIELIEQYIAECDTHTTYIEDDELAKKLVKVIEKSIKPKLPWYKRFWKWLKKPFSKKK